MTLEELNITSEELDAIEALVLTYVDVTEDDLDRNYLVNYVLDESAVADGMETEAEVAEWYYAEGDRAEMIARIASHYYEWRVSPNADERISE